jgi:hypothetical protein
MFIVSVAADRPSSVRSGMCAADAAPLGLKRFVAGLAINMSPLRG